MTSRAFLTRLINTWFAVSIEQSLKLCISPIARSWDKRNSKKYTTVMRMSCNHTEMDKSRLSGNPGSGKSTLMKYMNRGIRSLYRKKETLNQWATEGNFLVCSFFFWKLGSPLQKGYVGFLRSILYQISEQREDLIPILMGQQTTLESKTNEVNRSAPIYAWTKERLDDSLRRFIANKPASIHLCLLVDGLDEFDGDEDSLLETIHFLSRDPGTRICVSSRPEQRFRLGFASSPQLRLHDLNSRDIEKASMERLRPVLKQYFPHSASGIDDLVRSVTERSQGVFLWADLMCKDLRSGAHNADSMRELFERLDRTPGDIEGLYRHMLSRLDKFYLREAAGYFRLLLRAPLSSDGNLTILHIACGQEAAWASLLKKDFAHFQSLEFRDSCRKLETRIFTRCAGLVEISERQNKFHDGVYDDNGETRIGIHVQASQARDSVSGYLCEVAFIHRTVAEFLGSHEQFFQEPDWEWTARLAICRGRIGVMSLIPDTRSEANVGCISCWLSLVRLRETISEFPAMENHCPVLKHGQASHDDSFQLVDQIYEAAHYVYTISNGPDRTLSEIYGDDHNYFKGRSTITYYLPLQDRLGFAAHLGCYGYVSHYISVKTFSAIDLDYVSFCAIVGLDHSYIRDKWQVASITGLLRIVLSCLSQSDRSEVHFPQHFFTKSGTQIAKWVLFIRCSMKFFLYWRHDEDEDSPSYQEYQRIRMLWRDILTWFLENHRPDDMPFFSRWRAPLKIKGYNNIAEMGVGLCLEETVLAWTKRTFSSEGPEFMEDITALLESHGKLDRRSFRSIEIEDILKFNNKTYRLHPLKVLRLTDSQSEILTNAWSTAGLFRQAYPYVTAPDEEPRLARPGAETEKLVRMMLHVFRNIRSHGKHAWTPDTVLSWSDDY